jgi:hypothetical protein
MSGIRWRPKFSVLAISPETKKTVLSFSRRGKIRVCCITKPSIPIPDPIPILNFLDGGSPFSGGGIFYDGGSPTSGGQRIFDGGNP